MRKNNNKILPEIADCCNSYSEWSETRRCFIVIAFKLCFRIRHYV